MILTSAFFMGRSEVNRLFGFKTKFRLESLSLLNCKRMEEIIFVIKESPEGGYEAAALNHSIFTEADDWDQLKLNIKEAVSCHFEE